MIHCDNIFKTYRMGDVDVAALNGVSVDIAAGEFVAIMGPSGSGKSTLMHVLGLLDVPDCGAYTLMDRAIAGMTESELAALRAKSIGFVFQQFNLLARTSALENTALPLIYSAGDNAGRRPEELLREVGLGDRMGHHPSELSGGQQQRVAIARALVNRPRIIFADEPTGNLDSRSQEEIMALFERMNAQGITIVLVTHEEEVAKHARRIIRMRDGKIVEDTRGRGGEGETGRAGETANGRNGEEAKLADARKIWREGRTYLIQAARALAANKVRTGLSVLGILIGVAAVIAMLALGQGAKQSIEQRLSSMGTNLLSLRAGARGSRGVALEAGSVTRFTLDDAQALRELPHVTRVSPTVSGRAQAVFGNKNWNTQVQGTLPDFAPMRAYVPDIGRYFSEEESQSRQKVAVIGRTIARELFMREDGGPARLSHDGDAGPDRHSRDSGDGGFNPIGETIKINRINFQVIGLAPEKGATHWRDEDDLILIPLTTAMHRVFGRDYVDNIDIEVDHVSYMETVEAGIRQLVVRRHRLPEGKQDSFQIRNMAEMQEALTETSRTMSLLLASIAAISLLVGGIGIMNIMLVAVAERTREIGLRKALGARPKDILWQFLIEALVVSVGGGVAGIALGWLITLVMAHAAGWAVAISLSSIALAFGFSALIGVIFGLWPAKRAAALNPITALRYE